MRLKLDPTRNPQPARNSEFIRKVRSWGYANPINPRMVVIDNAVNLELSEWDGNVMLDTMIAFEKRKGHGTRVLKRLFALADEMGVTLTGHAKAIGDGGMRTTRLRQWYRSMGFKVTGDGDMIRRPAQTREAYDVIARTNALLEASFSPKDIPPRFFVALAIDGRDKDRIKQLAAGEVKGVSGVSGHGKIALDFFGRTGRGVLVSMPGKEFVGKNKLSRMMYQNPHYMLSKNMEAALRMWQASDTDPWFQGNKIAQYVGEAAGRRTDEFSQTLAQALRGSSFYFDSNMPEIRGVRDLAKYARETMLKEWKGTGIGVKLKKSTVEDWEGAIARGIKLAARTYEDEREWIVKDKNMRIPPGSKLLVMEPESEPYPHLRKMSDAELKAEKEADEKRWGRHSGKRSALESEENYREMLRQFKDLGIDKQFQIRTVSAEQWKSKASKARDRHYKRMNAEWRARDKVSAEDEDECDKGKGHWRTIGGKPTCIHGDEPVHKAVARRKRVGKQMATTESLVRRIDALLT